MKFDDDKYAIFVALLIWAVLFVTIIRKVQ